MHVCKCQHLWLASFQDQDLAVLLIIDKLLYALIQRPVTYTTCRECNDCPSQQGFVWCYESNCDVKNTLNHCEDRGTSHELTVNSAEKSLYICDQMRQPFSYS